MGPIATERPFDVEGEPTGGPAQGREAAAEASLADEFCERTVEQPELWGTDR